MLLRWHLKKKMRHLRNTIQRKFMYQTEKPNNLIYLFKSIRILKIDMILVGFLIGNICGCYNSPTNTHPYDMNFSAAVGDSSVDAGSILATERDLSQCSSLYASY